MTGLRNGQKVDLPLWFQWATGGFGAVLITVSGFAFTMRSDVNMLMKYKDDNEPLKLQMHQVQRDILGKLEAIEKDLSRIEKKQDDHISDFNKYKDEEAKATQEFYRRNPNL